MPLTVSSPEGSCHSHSVSGPKSHHLTQSLWVTGNLLRNQAIAVITAALMTPQQMLPEVAAQALEKHMFETLVGKVSCSLLEGLKTAPCLNCPCLHALHLHAAWGNDEGLAHPCCQHRQGLSPG